MVDATEFAQTEFCDEAGEGRVEVAHPQRWWRNLPGAHRWPIGDGVASTAMKSAKCENCGADAGPGATACGYCGVTFTGAAPGAATGPAGANPEIVRLLRTNQKIEAIKVYRHATKCGLREARDAVEAIEAALSRAR